MSDLIQAIKFVGVSKVASECGFSPRAVYKWLKKGTLPSTEFYGKTSYATTIERLSEGRFIATDILNESRNSLLNG